MIVDDYFHFDTNTQRMVFDNYATDHALWGAVMEKVYAKVNGNYAFLDGGIDVEAYNFLTGAPSAYYSH